MLSCNYLSSFIYLFLTPEFSGEEYKAAKVDPLAQFSKPVAVFIYDLTSASLLILISIFILSNDIMIFFLLVPYE